MGHARLGTLPKTQRWREVMGLLGASPDDTRGLARATLLASERRLRELGSDPSLTYCFWLLMRVTWAARSDAFTERLNELELPVRSDTSVLPFLSMVADRVREETAGNSSGIFTEIASLALRRTLSDAIGEYRLSLFSASVDELRAAVRPYSTSERFGELAQRFFGDFLARTLASFVDREVAVSASQADRNARHAGTDEFTGALALHARQSARILREYGAGWYSKNNWQSQGQVSIEDAGRFTAHALRKLRMELMREAER